MILALLLFMQVTVTPPQQTQPAAPMTQQAYGDLMYGGGGVAASHFATDGFHAMDQIWALPSFLTNSRSLENTVDQPQGLELSDTSIGIALGLVGIGMLLVLGVNVLSVARGSEPNPVAAMVAITVVALATLVAVNVRWFERFPIDIVNLLLTVLSTETVHGFATPGMSITSQVGLAVAALFAIAFLIVLLALTVVLYIESAWCVLLGGLMPLFVIGSVLPIFGSACQFMIRRWMGTLFSPVLVFAALRLATPLVNGLHQIGVPDLGLQVAQIAFAIIAWQAPGMVVGAISVAFPGIAQIYFAGRLFGTGRVSERMIGGGNSAAAGTGGALSREQPPRASAPRGTAGQAMARRGAGPATRKLPFN